MLGLKFNHVIKGATAIIDNKIIYIVKYAELMMFPLTNSDIVTS